MRRLTVLPTHRTSNINVEKELFVYAKVAKMSTGFKEVDVTNFSNQQGWRRFPAQDDFFSGLTVQDDDLFIHDEDEADSSQPPGIAEWRSNLVALSQRYNFYFAAYRDKIHVTIPRGLKQTLPGTPDLVLPLPRSQKAIRVGGFIDPARPHCVNNMIISDLGSHEILLMAFDDGDVIAYYTHAIIAAIESRNDTGSEVGIIKPLFHENVGASAWGLAIHEQSRLIAASSNLREVTVFMPAYTTDGDPRVEEFLQDSTFPEFPHLPESPSYRKINRRRVMKLGIEGHNVPSLSFASDVDGEARSILAADILGNLWIFDIYSDKRQRLPGVHPRSARGDVPMGWGVLVLPLNAFKHTSTPHEALGVHDLKSAMSVVEIGGETERIFDVTSHIRLRDSFNYDPSAPAVRLGQPTPNTASPLIPEEDEPGNLTKGDATSEETDAEPSEMVTDSSDEEGRALSILESEEDVTTVLGLLMEGPSDPDADSPESSVMDRRGSDMDYFQCLVNMNPALVPMPTNKQNLLDLLEKYTKLGSEEFEAMTPTAASEDEDMFLLPDNSAILRTYQYDAELIPPSRSMPRTICKRLVKQSASPAPYEVLRPFERLNLLAAIPPLSLVVVASQAGRAALLTLTRPDDQFSVNGPVVTFRVERMLPSNEHQHAGIRPPMPLMGMAVSPVQTDDMTGAKERRNAKRWRLILHYHDHTVLSYELSRDEQTDDLMVL